MRFFLALLCAGLLAGCGGDPEPDLDGLRAMLGSWQAASDARDAAGLAALYTTDAAMLPPNAEPIRGRAGIRQNFEGDFEAGNDVQLNDTDVFADMSSGYKVGTYTVATPDGQIVDDGKYIEVWHRVDGAWQMKYDIFNSNRPLPVAPPPPVVETEAEVLDEEDN